MYTILLPVLIEIVTWNDIARHAKCILDILKWRPTVRWCTLTIIKWTPFLRKRFEFLFFHISQKLGFNITTHIWAKFDFQLSLLDKCYLLCRNSIDIYLTIYSGNIFSPNMYYYRQYKHCFDGYEKGIFKQILTWNNLFASARYYLFHNKIPCF